VNQQLTKFQLNPQVVKLLAVVFLAAVVPLTVLVLGVRGWTAKSPEISPEVPGLRTALEQVASKRMPPPAELETACNRFVLMPGQGTPSMRQEVIEKSAKALGGSTIRVGQDDARLLVQIPSGAAGRFEEVALMGFASSHAPVQGGDTRIYEILLPSSP
jgi:hypothetical protein